MQIAEGWPRILCKPIEFIGLGCKKVSRLHPECLDDATTTNTKTNFCRLFFSLDSADRDAIHAAAGQIINASSVRSPPFLPFRPPTPSPVEICMHGWVGSHICPCLHIRIACEHMRASMRIGPYAPVCACAHALPCKIARAHACICISCIVHHNLATRVRTQPSMPQEHARTGTHSRACTQEADSDSDAAAARSDSDSDTEPSDGRGADIVSDSASEDDAPIGQEPPSNKKRAFQVVVDDEIALEEGQIRAQMVRWSCQLQLCAGP